ncbi:MAG: PBP1A family penicillin-binding protein [Nitrospiraceae bacterium]|nr:PBP1A family penicillin-binding protein [Nitrospiraceae bacterium]
MNKKTITILVTASIVTGIFFGGYLALAKGIPSIDELKQYSPTAGTKIFADDDTLIGELKAEKGIFVPIDKMPKHLINAVVAMEDARFWKHRGIDYIAIGRAILKDITHIGLKEGASTITQQLAKIAFLTPEKTIKRKLREAALAMKIERYLDKKEILELYLNKVYFGHGAYGVEMASHVYFGKSVTDITLSEAAILTALIKAPITYSPFNNLTRAKDRQSAVLLRMEEEGFIKKTEREKAVKEPLHLTSLRKENEANNYFVEYVRKYLEERFDEDTIYKAGLNVYTTLNKNLQLSAQKALQAGLRELDKRRGWRGPVEHKKDIDVGKEMSSKDVAYVIGTEDEITSGLVIKVSEKEAVIKTRGVLGKLPIANAQWASIALDRKTKKPYMIKGFNLTKIIKPGDIVKVRILGKKAKELMLALEQDTEIEGAVVSIEQSTGFIRALVGGYDFSKTEFNRAVNAKRQPGSAFKPIIYAAAMDNGYTPASIIEDEPVTYPGGLKGDWIPENYDRKFHGATRLRDALAYSRNIITIKLVDAIGISKIIAFSNNLGFEGDMPRDLSIALGSFSITPLSLTSIYSTFANNGVKMNPMAVKHITDANGSIIESNEPQGQEAVSPQTAFLITSMLKDVVNYGTGWRIKALGRPVAGKTGTTNEYRDAWFVGYTTGLTSCVWVGFDDMKPLGEKETGARAAAPIWLNFMRSETVGGSSIDFYPPEGIVQHSIDPKTGLLVDENTPGGIREYFKAGTQPTKYAGSVTLENKEVSNPDFD